jgi:hypothetical protein
MTALKTLILFLVYPFLYLELLMATHSKRVDPALKGGMYQVFSNDTSLTDAVVFATGDYIDFEACLGRPTRKLVLLINGAMDVTIKFNPVFSVSRHEETQANTTVTVAEDAANTNGIRFFAASGDFITFDTPEGFQVKNLKIVALTGTADASNNITFIGY